MNDDPDILAASLRALAITVARLAERAEMKASNDVPRQRAHPDSYLFEQSFAMLASIARSEYEARKRRCRYVDAQLLGEPAWDILLDLFIQQAAGKRVSLTSAALASHTPHATATRYFSALEQHGLVQRRRSDTDARVTFLMLTQEGLRRMGSYLQEQALTMLDADPSRAVPMDGLPSDHHVRTD